MYICTCVYMYICIYGRGEDFATPRSPLIRRRVFLRRVLARRVLASDVPFRFCCGSTPRALYSPRNNGPRSLSPRSPAHPPTSPSASSPRASSHRVRRSFQTLPRVNTPCTILSGRYLPAPPLIRRRVLLRRVLARRVLASDVPFRLCQGSNPRALYSPRNKMARGRSRAFLLFHKASALRQTALARAATLPRNS